MQSTKLNENAVKNNHWVRTRSTAPPRSVTGCSEVQHAVPGGQGPEGCGGGKPLNVRMTTSAEAPETGTLSYCCSAASNDGHRPSSSFLRTSSSVKQTSESSVLHVDCASPHVGQSPTGWASSQLSRQTWPPCTYSDVASSFVVVVATGLEDET